MELKEFIEIYTSLDQEARIQIVNFLKECGKQSDSREKASDIDCKDPLPHLSDQIGA